MKSSNVLKRNARNKIRNNYWHSVLVTFIVIVILSGGYKYNTFIYDRLYDFGNSFGGNKYFYLVDKILDIPENFVINYKPTRGVLSVFFNQITGTGSIILGIVNAIIQFVSFKSLPSFIIKMIGIVLFVMAFIFIQNIIVVGKNRYFIEHAKYKKVNVDRLMFVYRVRKTLNVAYIMIIKEVYNFLWLLTIVGGIYKYYSYFMIPYILAENPKITKEEAFILSNEMMDGNRFKLFKIQFSFIGWYLLGLLTFNISNIFYFDIYKDSIYCEFYFEIRNKLLKNKKYEKFFLDRELDNQFSEGIYDDDKYFISKKKKLNWLKFGDKVNYNVLNIILLFFTCAMVGWVWEVSLNFFVEGFFANKGTLLGPWLPIYGYGAILILLLLNDCKKKPLQFFIFAMLLSGVVEYFTGLYLDRVLHMRWWDYTGYFLNIQGYVSLEGLIVFALGGMVFTYYLAPFLNILYNKIDIKKKRILVFILCLLYIIDFIHSHYYPNTGVGITFFINLIN